MADNAKIVTLRGKTSYAKILLDQLHLNYGKDGKEWTVDLVLDKDTVKELKALGVGDRVKSKDNYLDGQPYLTFKQREYRTDPVKGQVLNDPIKIVEIDGKTPWDQSKALGNGTVVDLKATVRDYGVGKKKGVYIKAVRVLDHVPYESQDFAPVAETDEFYQKAQQAYVADEQFNQDFRPDLVEDELPI